MTGEATGYVTIRSSGIALIKFCSYPMSKLSGLQYPPIQPPIQISIHPPPTPFMPPVPLPIVSGDTSLPTPPPDKTFPEQLAEVLNKTFQVNIGLSAKVSHTDICCQSNASSLAQADSSSNSHGRKRAYSMKRDCYGRFCK